MVTARTDIQRKKQRYFKVDQPSEKYKTFQALKPTLY